MSQFTFNGTLIENLVIERGFAIPAFSYHDIGEVVIPGRHGAIHATNRLRSRVFTIPVMLFFTNEADLQAKKEHVASQLITDEAKELIFECEPNRKLFAMFSGGLTLDESELNVAKGTLNVICHNPFKHALTSTLVPLTTGNTTINNQGSATAFPTIRITGITGSEFIVRHHEQNKECRIVWNFEDWMELEIDMDKEIIRINGNVQMAAFDWRSEMFNINPGINTISTNASPVTGAVEFTTRWL